MENKNTRKQRKFNVEFFSICELKNQQETLVSLPVSMKYFFDKSMEIKPKERFMNINGENIRLQTIRKIEESYLEEYSNLQNSQNLWEIVFIKFKDSEVFGLADDEGNYDENALEAILASEEYNKKRLASPTPCIYDESKNIIVIPRNKEGVSSSTILEFMRRICSKKNLDFGYITKGDEVSFCGEVDFKNLEISIGDLTLMTQAVEQKLTNTAPTVFGAIKAAKETGCDTATVTGTMGNKKKSSLTLQTGKDMLALSRIGCGSINRLRLGISKNGNKNIHRVDLLQDKLIDSFVVYYSSKERIKSKDILLKLLKSYDYNYVKIKLC